MKKAFCTAAAAAFLLSGGIAVAQDKGAAPKDKKNEEATFRLLNLFGDVFEQVRANYVEEVSDETLIEAAISGMLASLDPHSSYMNSKSYKDMQVQTRGNFGGLGIEVSMENGVVKVVSPIDDTPAHRAGIQPGDLITHLDGKQIQGLTLNEAVEMMRGKVGTDIKLTVVRQTKEPFDVTVTRAVIPIRTVRSRIEGNDVAYIRISSFSQPTADGLKAEMKKMTDQMGDKMKGVVLDLRNNPGGLLEQAIAVSDAFLEQGEIVSTRSRAKEDQQRFNARPGDLASGKPIVVLINSGSASASEIVAGALQDHKRAILLGTSSFGKGSVQTIRPLGQYGAMRLTTALYYTPSGRSIQKTGIDPDIMVEQAKIETLKSAQQRRRESDLRGAIDRPGSNGEKPSIETPDGRKPVEQPGGEKKDELLDRSVEGPTAQPEQDYQLQRALDLLRGVSMFSQRGKS
jgi:carboxyl-terminal processing protease